MDGQSGGSLTSKPLADPARLLLASERQLSRPAFGLSSVRGDEAPAQERAITIRLTGAQLDMLLIAQMHPEGAHWPPPVRLRHTVDPLLAAGLIVREDERVVLSAEGVAAIARDERAAELREELSALEGLLSANGEHQTDPALEDRT